MEKSVRFLDLINKSFGLEEVDIRTYSPLTLAYIGDAVYEMIFRSVVVERGNTSPGKLHQRTVEYVKAPAQARMADAVMESLGEEERAVYKRGKNAKPYSMAKNASIVQYKKATGLEALIGYLYLTGREERALKLIRTGLENMDNREGEREE